MKTESIAQQLGNGPHAINEEKRILVQKTRKKAKKVVQ